MGTNSWYLILFDNYRKSSFVFLDRDVLNEDEGHVHKPEDLRILPNVVNGLLELKSLDFKFIIITNQAGIAKGIYRKRPFTNLCKHY